MFIGVQFNQISNKNIRDTLYKFQKSMDRSVFKLTIFELKVNKQYFQHNMWYKYVDRVGYDAVRVWRRTNLKFNQDDNGMLKSKHPGWFSQHLFRAARSEGPIRGSFGFLFVAVMNVYLWYSGEQEKVQAPIKAEKKRLEDEKNDKEARDTLWYNRFGVASRPIRSIQNFMTFIASEKTLNEAFEYIGYKGTVEAYEDYQAGLDGIASDDDRKMLAYYKESLKHKSHH